MVGRKPFPYTVQPHPLVAPPIKWVEHTHYPSAAYLDLNAYCLEWIVDHDERVPAKMPGLSFGQFYLTKTKQYCLRKGKCLVCVLSQYPIDRSYFGTDTWEPMTEHHPGCFLAKMGPCRDPILGPLTEFPVKY